MNRPVAAALAIIALIAAPSFALADNFVARVKTSDLNLQTDQGVKAALQRVHRAAVDACTDTEVGTRIGHADAACVDKISSQLIQRLNTPTVQAAYDAAKKDAGQQG